MDIRIQTKIAVLLEKINYLNSGIQQQGGAVSKVDKDLLTSYVRELYELILSLPLQPSAYPDPNYMYQTAQPVYPQQPQQQSQPEPPSYQPQSPNGFYPPNASPIGNMQTPLNGNGVYTNPSQPPVPTSQPSTLNPAFAVAPDGKRTLSESIRIKTGSETPSLNEQFKKDESHLAGKMQLTPIKDLKTFIGLNKRFAYINFLFGNDANLYDEAIEKLNTAASRQTAVDYLDNHLRPKLRWTSDNDMVEEFYSIVERRYMG